MSEPDCQARLDANPEVGQRIDEFLAHPETGIQRERPARRLPADGHVYPDETNQA